MAFTETFRSASAKKEGRDEDLLFAGWMWQKRGKMSTGKTLQQACCSEPWGYGSEAAACGAAYGKWTVGPEQEDAAIVWSSMTLVTFILRGHLGHIRDQEMRLCAFEVKEDFEEV